MLRFTILKLINFENTFFKRNMIIIELHTVLFKYFFIFESHDFSIGVKQKFYSREFDTCYNTIF